MVSFITFLCALYSLGLAKSSCLIEALNALDSCELCSPDFFSFNSLLKNKSNQGGCQPKIKERQYLREAFIKKRSNCSEGKGSSLEPYCTLNEALKTESLAAALYQEAFLKLLLITDVFYIEEEAGGFNYFRNVNVSLTIRPAYCEFYPQMEDCVSLFEKPTIYLKSHTLTLFIFNYLRIENLNIDGRDLWTEPSSCKGSEEICCSESRIQAGYFNSSCFKYRFKDLWDFSLGLINLEPFIGPEGAISTPKLEVIDVELKYIVLGDSSENLNRVFIKTWNFISFTLNLRRVIISNCFFPFHGLVLTATQADSLVSKAILDFLIKKSTSPELLFSKIYMEEIHISSYGLMNFSNSKTQRLFSLPGFLGNFSLINCAFLFISFDSLKESSIIYFDDWNDLNLDYSFLKDNAINISNLTVKNSIARTFFSGLHRKLSGKSPKIRVTSIMKSNRMNQTFVLSSISSFIIESNYSGYAPSVCFICFEYSQVIFTNSQFTDLSKHPYSSETIPAVLMSTSFYQVSLVDQFNAYIEKKQQLAVDEITVTSFKLVNASIKCSFATNLHSIYRLSIMNSEFSQIDLGVARFIRLSVEGLFFISNSTFSDVKAQIHFILIEPGYQLELANVVIFKFLISNGAIAQLKSFTLYKDTHTFRLINLTVEKVYFTITDLPIFLVSSEGSKIFLFSCRYETSGYGTNALIKNSAFSNVFVSDVYDNMFFFFSACGRLNISDTSFNNITNSLVIYFLSTIIDGSVVLSNVLCDLEGLPIVKFFKTSTEYFDRITLSNVNILSALVFDSSLIQVNNVINFLILNSSMKGACRNGPLLVVGVKELKNFQCNNVYFEGEPRLKAKTGGLSFQTLLKTFSLSNYTLILKISQVGIYNCTFFNLDSSAIKVLQNTQILIQKISVYNVSAEYGAGIKTEGLSSLFISDVVVGKLFAFISGAFLFCENSLVVLRSCNVTAVEAQELGGALMLIGSNVSMCRLNFFYTVAKLGGAISAENTELTIEACKFFFGIGRKSGGFLNKLYGTLRVADAEFIRGKALAKAACLNLEGTNTMLVNVIIKESEADKIGAIVLLGAEDVKAYLINIKFIDNWAKNCPTIVMHNLKAYLFGVTLLNNTSDDNLIEIYQSFAPTCVVLKRLIFKENSVVNALIKATSHLLALVEADFIDNLARNHIKSASCDLIFLKKVLMIAAPQKTLNLVQVIAERAYFLELRSNTVILEDFVLRGQRNHGGVSGQSCGLVVLKRAVIQDALGISGAAISLDKTPMILEDSLITSSLGYENAVLTSSNAGRLNLINSVLSFNQQLSEKSDTPSDISFKKNEQSSRPMKVLLFNISIFNISKISISVSSSEVFVSNSALIGNANGASSQAVQLRDCKEMHFASLVLLNFYSLGAMNIESKKSAQSSILLLTNGLFLNGSNFRSGGAISITGLVTVIIKGSIFRNQVSFQDGGAIYYECPFVNSDCVIMLAASTNFINNSASKRGGAAFIANRNDKLIYEDVYFESNSARIGKDFASAPSQIIITTSLTKESVKRLRESFMRNTGNSLEESASLIKNISNGEKTLEVMIGKNFDIAFFLVDDIGNILSDVSMVIFQINLDLNNAGEDLLLLNAKIANNFAVIESGVGFFESLSISAANKTKSVSATIFCSESTTRLAKLKKKITFALAPCGLGDIFVDNMCIKCPRGSFSFGADPIEEGISFCQPCPKYATCKGGSSVQPQAGYWRINNQSDFIVDCPNEEACPSSESGDAGDSDCGEGYEGAFCGYCKRGFAQISSKCINCSDFRHAFGILVPYFLFFSFAFLAQRDLLSSNENAEIRILTNTLSNHFSNLMIISMFDLNWHVDVANVLALFRFYISPNSQNMFSLGCILPLTRDSSQQATLLFTTISPLVFVMIFLLLREILLLLSRLVELATKRRLMNKEVSAFKSAKLLLQNIKLSSLLIFFNIYPTLILSFIQSVDCIRIDKNIEVLKISPDVDCSASSFLFYKITAGISLLFWGLGIPFLFFSISRNFIKNLPTIKTVKAQKYTVFSKKIQNIINSSPQPTEANINQRINNVSSAPKRAKTQNDSSELGRFLTQGYTEKYYFWETVIYLRKLFIILVSLLRNYLHVMSISGIVIVVFFVLFIFNMKARIFVSQKINYMETLSLMVAILTLSFGLLVRNENNSQEFNIVFLVLVLVVNVFFFFAWALFYISLQLNEIRGKIEKFTTWRKKRNGTGTFKQQIKLQINQHEA